MTDNYAKILKNNLGQLYENLPQDLAINLPGEQEGKRFVFDAFGKSCRIEPEWITLFFMKRMTISLLQLHAYFQITLGYFCR
jgi:hypothetical protein